MVGMDGLWPSPEDAPGFQHTAQVRACSLDYCKP